MTALHAPATQAPVTLAPVSLARLVQIELRKAVDTRAGRWLLVVIALVALGTAILTAVTGSAGDRNLPRVLGDAIQLVSVLLPVLGILLVTSEWSQHTALTTFTLVPRRSRIIGAKVAAGVLLAAAGTVSALAGTGRWLDPSTAWNHLADGTMTATTWAQSGPRPRRGSAAGPGGRLARAAPPGRRLTRKASLGAWLSCSCCGTWTTRWWARTAWARACTRWCSGRCSAAS
jgi:hypothetical protein